MKRPFAVAAFFLALGAAVPAMAASEHGHGAMPMAEQHAQMSDGEIKKLDAGKGRVTIKHGPLHNLGMGAMTMTFQADGAMLKNHKPGDKVRFLAEDRDGKLTVTSMEAAQ
ncbi:copper-binding protein [Denitromonas sp.]|uniref:copper-binding protein n=1 Tax=Denitromonas sp. TaxID=2734609 RepID=UPI003A8B6E78